MSQEVEIEFKTLLTAADYQKLLNYYAALETDFFLQTNVYYDTPDFSLKRKGMGLRIRLFEDYGELTLKSPLPNKQRGLLETTDRLTITEATSFVATETILNTGAVAAFLIEMGIETEELTVQANLTTKRWENSLSEAILLVLDESWYHGQHDYELEMEVQQANTGYDFFTLFLAKHHIPLLKGKNKIQRAVAAKKA